MFIPVTDMRRNTVKNFPLLRRLVPTASLTITENTDKKNAHFLVQPGKCALCLIETTGLRASAAVSYRSTLNDDSFDGSFGQHFPHSFVGTVFQLGTQCLEYVERLLNIFSGMLRRRDKP